MMVALVAMALYFLVLLLEVRVRKLRNAHHTKKCKLYYHEKDEEEKKKPAAKTLSITEESETVESLCPPSSTPGRFPVFFLLRRGFAVSSIQLLDYRSQGFDDPDACLRIDRWQHPIQLSYDGGIWYHSLLSCVE